MNSTFFGRKIAAAALLSIVFFFGCTRYIDPVSPVNTGSIIGTVKAYGVVAPNLINPSGIFITLQGSQFQTLSDSAGNFRIDGIPAGVYNIIFSKPGFDSMVYPVHHLLGAGTDIINDAYIIAASEDSLSVVSIIPVFKVSITKIIHVIDTIIKGGLDTIIRSYDTTIITYDTVQSPTNLIINGTLVGNNPPKNLFIYSSLDSTLFPNSKSPESTGITEDEWLDNHIMDTTFRAAFGVPTIINSKFCDTLWADVYNRLPFSFDHGQRIYIYIVGHSNTEGLPPLGGQYEHFLTPVYGPKPLRYLYIVP